MDKSERYIKDINRFLQEEMRVGVVRNMLSLGITSLTLKEVKTWVEHIYSNVPLFATLTFEDQSLRSHVIKVCVDSEEFASAGIFNYDFDNNFNTYMQTTSEEDSLKDLLDEIEFEKVLFPEGTDSTSLLDVHNQSLAVKLDALMDTLRVALPGLKTATIDGFEMVYLCFASNFVLEVNFHDLINRSLAKWQKCKSI